jgi:hypothetical protein
MQGVNLTVPFVELSKTAPRGANGRRLGRNHEYDRARPSPRKLVSSGFTTLSAQSGQSVPLLLTYWNVASAVFQTPAYTAADVRTTVPSFNFANIFGVGQTGWSCNGTPCGFFTNGPPAPVYPVAPIAFNSGAFSRTVHSVPGTSASFFLLSGTTGGIETLYLLNGTGSALSSSSGFRVAILRVQ